MGIIKRNFMYLTPHSFLILYKYLVRSHLDMESVFRRHTMNILLKNYKKELQN